MYPVIKIKIIYVSLGIQLLYRLAFVPFGLLIYCFKVLIRVLTIGVNPYETYQRSASYAEVFPGILGSDCAGIVAQVGSQVRRVKVCAMFCF